MNNIEILLMILTMALVTYLIRLIPFVVFKKKIKSTFIKSLLYYLPYAVLTAMTFPTIFFVTGNVVSGIVGATVAIIASISKRSLIIVAMLSVISVLICNGIILLI